MTPNFPFGAGSQFASFALNGELDWRGLLSHRGGDKLVALVERVAIQWISSQEIVLIIDRHRLVTLHGRELSLLK